VEVVISSVGKTRFYCIRHPCPQKTTAYGTSQASNYILASSAVSSCAHAPQKLHACFTASVKCCSQHVDAQQCKQPNTSNHESSNALPQKRLPVAYRKITAHIAWTQLPDTTRLNPELDCPLSTSLQNTARTSMHTAACCSQTASHASKHIAWNSQQPHEQLKHT
jgi:glutamine synthetase adenylyltransferase